MDPKSFLLKHWSLWKDHVTISLLGFRFNLRSWEFPRRAQPSVLPRRFQDSLQYLSWVSGGYSDGIILASLGRDQGNQEYFDFSKTWPIFCIQLEPFKKTDWREFYGICMVTLVDSFLNFNLLDCISLWWVHFELVSIWTKGTCWCRSSLHALFSHHVPQKSKLGCLVLPHHTIRNFPSQSTEQHIIMANHSNENFTVRSTRNIRGVQELSVWINHYISTSRTWNTWNYRTTGMNAFPY